MRRLPSPLSSLLRTIPCRVRVGAAIQEESGSIFRVRERDGLVAVFLAEAAGEDLAEERLEELCAFFLTFFASNSGMTAPPEINNFMPSPKDMSIANTSSLGTNRRKPLVGLGVVGTKTVVNWRPITASVSPSASFVRKPIV